MSVDSLLDSAFTTLLGKALREREDEFATPRTATVNFEWGGGGLPLTITAVDPLLVEVPFASRIVWAHLYAGDGTGLPAVVTADFELRLTQFSGFGSSVALYGTGTAPGLSSTSRADIDVSGWQLNLLTGDALIARPTTIIGTANWLAIVLLLRQIDDMSTLVVDAAGNTYVDASGNPYVFRSGG